MVLRSFGRAGNAPRGAGAAGGGGRCLRRLRGGLGGRAQRASGVAATWRAMRSNTIRRVELFLFEALVECFVFSLAGRRFCLGARFCLWLS